MTDEDPLAEVFFWMVKSGVSGMANGNSAILSIRGEFTEILGDSTGLIMVIFLPRGFLNLGKEDTIPPQSARVVDGSCKGITAMSKVRANENISIIALQLFLLKVAKSFIKLTMNAEVPGTDHSSRKL